MKTARFIILLTLFWPLSVYAQLSPRDEIAANPNFAASNSMAYQQPAKKLTPAPRGMKPFYLSHYGRHGSRYLTKTEDYHYVVRCLKLADEHNKLTAVGKDVLRRAEMLAQQAQNRWGDLTAIGVKQHKDIVSRMARNFPALFRKNATVDCRSTLVPRCVLSMTSAIQQLAVINPRLRVTYDASSHDLFYMNFQDKKLRAMTRPDTLEHVYNEFCARYWKFDRLLNILFNDKAYVDKNIDKQQLNYYLFRLAGSVQNTDLRDKVTLYDIFLPNEIYDYWLTANAWWYLSYGFTPLNGGTQPYTQRYLLRQLISDADSVIGQENTHVHLRFGHDTMILPLVCLMNINGYAVSVDNLDSLVARGWIDYRVFPMSANLQLVFYRKNIHDRDVLLKVLLNEQEATLPVKTGMYPYYRWADVKDYLLKLLDKEI